MPESNITLEELLASLGEESDNFDGLTVRELCTILQKGERWVYRRLQQVQMDGKLEVGRKYVTDLSGRVNQVPAYRLK